MALFTTTFTVTGSEDTIYFAFSEGGKGSLDNVSLREVTHEVVDSNIPVKEFLTGTDDDGQEIFFRADTQVIQIQSSPELYSSPIAIVTETERGSMMKGFVSLDEKPFYSLDGTVTKGISVLKFTTPGATVPKPPLAQTLQISYRDSSLQLCRIIQMAIITNSTPIDLPE